MPRRPAPLTRPDATQSARLIRQAEDWAQRIPGADSPEPVVGDWTWQDLRRAAGYALSRVRMSEGVHFEDNLRTVALSAIALAATQDPNMTMFDLVFAGVRELNGLRYEAGRSRGYNLHANRVMPRFSVYWLDWNSTPMPTDVCETSLTLEAVWNALPDEHRLVLAAHATSTSTYAAAELSGLSYFGYMHRLARARKAALALWFDHETPPDLKRLPIVSRQQDPTCAQGHEMTGDNIRRERTKTGRTTYRCKTCRNERDRNRRERQVPV